MNGWWLGWCTPTAEPQVPPQKQHYLFMKHANIKLSCRGRLHCHEWDRNVHSLINYVEKGRPAVVLKQRLKSECQSSVSQQPKRTEKKQINR